MKKILNNSAAIPFIFLLIFISMEFLGGLYVSFLSFRHVAVACMFFYVIRHFKALIVVMKRESLFSFYILFFYYLYVSLLGVFNGLYYDNFGVTLILARFLPFTICFLFMTIVYAHRRDSIDMCTNILYLVLIVDSIITIMQGLNIDIGWQIRALLSSDNTAWELMENRDDSVGCSIVSGLFVYSVENGYFLASYGCIVFFFLHKQRKSYILFILGALLTFMALFFTQQRMAMYVYIASCVILSFYLDRKLSILFFIFYFVINFVGNDIAFDVGRLENYYDNNRVMMLGNFFSFFPEHLFLGDRTIYVATYGITPHSFFLESFLLGGIFGMLMMIAFFVYIVCLVFVKGRSCTNAFVIYAVSVISFIMVSMTHSSGFHTGFTIIIPLYVFMLLTSSAKKHVNCITNDQNTLSY